MKPLNIWKIAPVNRGGGRGYTKINKNKKMSYISYTVYSCHLEQKFRFLQHEKPDNLKLLAISKSRTFFGPLKVEDNGSRMYLFIYLVTYSVTYRSWKNIWLRELSITHLRSVLVFGVHKFKHLPLVCS